MRCFKCGRRAYFRFSPDLDITGLGACKKHLKTIQTAYGLLTLDSDLFADFTKGWWGVNYIEDTARQQHDLKTGEPLDSPIGERL